MDELFKELQSKGLCAETRLANFPVWLLNTGKLGLNFFGLLYQYQGEYGRN